MPLTVRVAAALLLSLALHDSAGAGSLTKGSISRGNSNGCFGGPTPDAQFYAPATPVYLIVDTNDPFLDTFLTVTGDSTPIDPTFTTQFLGLNPTYYYVLYSGLVPGGSYTLDVACPDPGQTVTVTFEVISGACTVPSYASSTNLLWTDLGDARDPLRIERIELATSYRTILATLPGLSVPQAVDVDPLGGWIYFADSGLDAIGRMRADGGQQDSIVPNELEPRDVAFGGLWIYWVDEHRNLVRRATTTGANPQTIATTSGATPSIAFDPVLGKVYWSEPALDRIRRCDDDGANVETFLSFVPDGIREPLGLEVDVTGRVLYWVDGAQNSIQRTGLDGTGPIELVVDAQDGLGAPQHLAYDAQTDILYFTDQATASVRKIPAPGVIQDVVTSGLAVVRGLALERRPIELGGFVYFAVDDANALVHDFGEVTAANPTRVINVDFGASVQASGTIISTCSQFVVNNPDFDFPVGGGSTIFSVTYAPQGPGVHAAELLVQTDQSWLTSDTRRLMIGSSTICATLPPSEPCRYPDSVLDDTTGEDQARMLRRPDEISAKIRDDAVTLSFDCAIIVDGPGPDFNVYELSEAPQEFDEIDVLVSTDGVSFFSVKASEAAWVDIDGDELHQDPAFARSYDLAGVLDQAGWVRIQGLPAGAVDGFDLDAVGIVHGASDCNDNLVDDGCELALDDANGNLVLDACEPDCDGDGVSDADEIAAGAPDVNLNGAPDACDADCDTDGIIDSAEPGVFDLSSNDCRFPATLVESTTGFGPEAVIGAPDDVWLDLGGQRLTYRLDCALIVDGPGPDFNLYEQDSGAVEFGRIEVYVSENGASFHRVTESAGPVVPIVGDEVHGDPAFARSYRLDGTGLSQARYVKIDADGDTSAGFGLGFDLDALGVIHAGADANGDGTLDVCQTGTDTPAVSTRRDRLYPPSPNPFNPRTTLRFELAESTRVDLIVYDLAGRRVRALLESEPSQPGLFETVWNGRDDLGRRVASGVYLLRLRTQSFVSTQRMILLK